MSLIGQDELNEWLREQKAMAEGLIAEKKSDMKIEDWRRGKFYWIRNNVLEKIAPVTGVYGVAIYNILAYFASGYTRESFPSITKIAKFLGCGRHKVVETLEKLESLKVIEIERREGKCNIYRLVDID